MITLSTRAKDALERLVLARLHGLGRSLRLAPAGAAQFGLVPDVPRPDDRRVEHHGTVVLLLSAPLAARLDGWTLDCVEAGDGAGATLRLRPDRGRRD